jgi:integrase
VKKIRFTDVTLRTLPEGKYGDLLLPAFCLRVGKTRRTFYTVRNGRVTTIGQWPTKSLQDARKAARLILDTNGSQPRTLTFRDAYDQYQAHHLINYRPNTQYQTDRLIDRYCAHLYHRNLQDIRSLEITALLVKTSPSAANHLFGVLRTFLRWCERKDLITTSPLAKLSKPYKEASRDRLLSDDELVRIWNACTGQHGIICKALILSGQRRGQFSRFDQCYVKTDTIVWPPTAMKHGQQHTIPMSKTLHALVTQLHPTHNTWGKPIDALRKASKVHDFTCHDFRRYVSSTMRHLKVPIDCTEYLLAHTAGSRTEIQRIYDRYDRLPELRQALSLYEKHLTNIGIKL